MVRRSSLDTLISGDVVEGRVSIIIPTKNSAKHIKKCLISVFNQTYRNIEVVIVDNHSSDGTPAIAKTFPITFITKGPERSAQVNYGVKHSTGEYIYYIGSDFVLSRETVQRCVDLMRECDAVIVPNYTLASNLLGKLIALRRRMASQDPLSMAPRFFKRSVFDYLGGYNENLVIGEDLEFARRIIEAGFKVKICKSAAELNVGEPMRIQDFIRKQVYYGSFLSYYVRLNRSVFAKQINILRFLSRSNTHPLIILVLFLELIRSMCMLVGFLSKLVLR